MIYEIPSAPGAAEDVTCSEYEVLFLPNVHQSLMTSARLEQAQVGCISLILLFSPT